MTDKQQPAQFEWATELSDAQGHVTLSEQEAHEIGARLRRMGEKLKAYEDLDGAADDVQLLRMGYAAARLEIESLKAQLAEHASHGQAPRDAEREMEMTQQFNAGRQYEAGRIAARVAAAQQAPAGATPEGWVTWWPSPSSKGHEPIYSHGPKQPDYGAELDAVLRKYPVFAAPAAPSTPEDGGEDAEELRLLRALAFSVERAIGNGVMPLDIEEAYEGYDKWSAARAAHKEGDKT